MDTWVVALTLSTSVFMGFLGLVALLWGLGSGQFDDENKFVHSVLFDDVDDLNAVAVRDDKARRIRKD